jgi:hypothetical protein
VESDDVVDVAESIPNFLTVWAPHGNWVKVTLYAFAYVTPLRRS